MHMPAESCLQRGLLELSFSVDKVEDMSQATKERHFHAHCGSSPAVLAHVWNDLCATDVAAARIPHDKRNASGFKMHLVACFHMWNKPRNALVLASRFRIAESRAQGEALWQWINRIAALKAVKITWDEALDDPNNEFFTISLDGVDFKTREEKHETLPVNPQMKSHKMNHAAWKCEIAAAAFRERIVFASGPEQAATHDLTMFRNNGLKEKMLELPGKMIAADAGCQTSANDEKCMFATPNQCDPDVLCNFKSRVRLRQETLNGRMKDFAILKHGFELGKDKHAACFHAVLVTQQHKMDHGSFLHQP